jgi:hypothetical protein
MGRSFNGSSEYIDLTSNFGLVEPMTLAVRFNPTNITLAGTLVGLVDVSIADAFSLFFRGDVANDPVEAQSQDSGVSTGTADTSATSAAAGTWYGAIANFVSSTSRAAYFSGGASGTNTTSCTPTSMFKVRIGQRSGIWFNGSLADVSAWSVSLDAAERDAYFKGFPARRIRPQSLKFNLPMVRELILNPNGASVIADFSGGQVDHPRAYGR